jgi:5'-nucleotidase
MSKPSLNSWRTEQIVIGTHARLGVIPMFMSLVAFFAWPAYGQTDSYHILLTNDDGIESQGIQVLAEKLKAVGQVHLVAPCGERSGSSMSVALRDELHLRPVLRDGITLGHCVDTTPAGTVLLAISTLTPEGGFDLVISGINRGANVGTASYMSGTVGGAMMGAFYGVPAMAVSFGARSADYDYAADFVAAFVEEMRQRPAMPGIVFSINIPRATEAETAGVTFAKMGGIHLQFAYEELPAEGDARRFRPRISLETDYPAESDTEAFMGGMITITPLQFDWTAYSVMDQLKGWGVSHEVGGSGG